LQKFRFAGGIWGVLAIWEAFGVFFHRRVFRGKPPRFWPMQSVATLICHLPVALGALWAARLRLDAEEPVYVCEVSRERGLSLGRTSKTSAFNRRRPINKTPRRSRSCDARANMEISRMWKPFDELFELIARHANEGEDAGMGNHRHARVRRRAATSTPRHTQLAIAAYFCGFSALMALRVTGGTSPQQSSPT
jgi:hypothetical protein